MRAVAREREHLRAERGEHARPGGLCRARGRTGQRDAGVHPVEVLAHRAQRRIVGAAEQRLRERRVRDAEPEQEAVARLLAERALRRRHRSAARARRSSRCRSRPRAAAWRRAAARRSPSRRAAAPSAATAPNSRAPRSAARPRPPAASEPPSSEHQTPNLPSSIAYPPRPNTKAPPRICAIFYPWLPNAQRAPLRRGPHQRRDRGAARRLLAARGALLPLSRVSDDSGAARRLRRGAAARPAARRNAGRRGRGRDRGRCSADRSSASSASRSRSPRSGSAARTSRSERSISR